MATKLPKSIALSLPKGKSGWFAADGERGVEQFWRDGKPVDKKFRARITVVEGGKRKQVTRRADSYRKASDLRADLSSKSRELGGKEKIDAERVTFRQLAKKYREQE